ncbi:calpain-A-like isoform X1 [Haliotis asinina]|uniref:calpain-A-like isoform X1 n=1 Tax=Haliotis asinina TaxID=109174 RepID=UPI003531D976
MGCSSSKEAKDFDNINDSDDDREPYTDVYHNNPQGLGLKQYTVDFRITPGSDEGMSRPTVPIGENWTDPEFPLEVAITDESRVDVEWKRPQEFVQDPVLFADGPFRLDIEQRSFGTCWFLSMLSSLADNQDLCRRVINETSYIPETDGICHCRFWNFGKWRDVYIDDYLPVFAGSRHLYGAASGTNINEMWVPLMEKALARFHGSYTMIRGGLSSDAYLLLTGGISERIDFLRNNSRLAPAELYSRIKTSLSNGGLLTCGVSKDNNGHLGLMGPHSYSLNASSVVTRQNGEKAHLLRIRNPHGTHEWTGKWNDQDPEWDTLREGKDIRTNRNEGEFWISLEDFLEYFYRVTICSQLPDFDRDGQPDSLRYVLNIFGEWRGKTAVGPGRTLRERLRNPRLSFTVPRKGSRDKEHVPVLVQLIQKTNLKEYAAISCDLFKMTYANEGSSTYYVYQMEDTEYRNSYFPNLQATFRYMLPPGRYLVLPSTYQRGVQKEFLIRVFSPGPLHKCRSIPSEVTLIPSHQWE